MESKLMKNLVASLPAIFALAYVAMSAVTFTYIDETSVPVSDEDAKKRENARISAMVNLILSSVVLILMMFIYFKAFKAQKQYITYF